MVASNRDASSSSSWAQNSWSLYNVLLLLRVCVAPVLVGYVHPDEFFQGGQELWFGCPPTIPWEFEPNNALRSIVPPSLMTWWPLQLYSDAFGIPMEQLSGRIVWILPRVACSIVSIFAVDWSVWALARSQNFNQDTTTTTKGVPLPVLVVASAWPTFVLISRPFTNAMETWVLALLFRVVLADWRDAKNPEKTIISYRQCLMVGALSALGIFTRFTFGCFALPIILYFGRKMLRHTGIFFIKPAFTYLVFLYTVGAIMDRDAEFYGRGTLTPWNAFSYNSRAENLQEHGLHPRWTHAAVNMMILYGPMAIMGYAILGFSARWVVGTPSSIDATTVVTLSKWIIICGLGLLSTAPHQEPRFLLPLVVPLALLMDNPWARKYEGLLSKVWLGFNVALVLFFGVLHQGGVVPSLLAMGSSLVDKSPSAVIFYHTYMPPTFLSRLVGSRRGHSCKGLPIIDLDGSNDLSSLKATVNEELSCSEGGDAKSYVHIVASPWAADDDLEWMFGNGQCRIAGYSCESIWQHSPHLSTEDFPSLGDLANRGLPLSIYEVSCKL